MLGRRGVGRHVAALAILTALGAGCGWTTPAAQASPNASPSPTGAACASGGPASADWPAPASRTGTFTPIALALASGNGFDIVFDQGTPSFEVRRQNNTHFLLDPSGQPIDLRGSYGATIILRGLRGGMPNYSGPKSQTPSGPLLLQVYELGDTEGVVTWGFGFSGPACATELTAGTDLSFKFVPAQP